MKHTTLCYIEDGDKYLMLHRTKKQNDENKDKWIGVGGKFEDGESPYDCARREIYEETGISEPKLFYRGIVTFVSDIYGTEYMHLFTASCEIKALKECDEGELVWVKKDDVAKLPIWEGDKIFFNLLNQKQPFFSLKLCYRSEKLISYVVE